MSGVGTVAGLTQEEMVARAVALRPRLVADQAATEERTYYSPRMHEAFLDAGFYHLYVPRRYGGYEFDVPTYVFDVPTYVRVVQEIARGCVSTAWCLGLAMNHALMVGSWWPQEAQDEIFAGGDFRCASVAAPVGRAERTDSGWEINGQVAFASGAPWSTFYWARRSCRRRRMPARTIPRRCSCSSRPGRSGRCSTTGATCSG
jgi:3-hydroxy-9,10-secoandrosta-1,3,5(10)-triene-9,17-dione monooxygenase